MINLLCAIVCATIGAIYIRWYGKACVTNERNQLLDWYAIWACVSLLIAGCNLNMFLCGR